MSFPQRHPLCGPGANTSYDFTLGLEQPGTVALIGPSLATLLSRDSANIGFGGIAPGVARGGGAGRGGRGGGAPAGRTMDIDAEGSLPAIIDEVRRQMSPDKQRVIQERSAKHATANQTARIEALTRALEQRRAGWDASPISTARVYAELWPLIVDEDWILSSPSNFSGAHNAQLWDHNKPYSYLGGQGAAGMGYGAPASVGAALAAKSRKQIVINVQTDGDLNYAPGVLWTAQHHQLPMLTVMHNNRAWHQELMFVEYMCGVRGRGTERGHIGTTLRDPFIDYRMMAACVRHGGGGTDHRSGEARSGVEARPRLGEEGDAVHDRRDHAAAVNHDHQVFGADVRRRGGARGRIAIGAAGRDACAAAAGAPGCANRQAGHGADESCDGECGHRQEAVLRPRLLLVPRVQRRDRSASVRAQLAGEPGDRAQLHRVPARPRQPGAGAAVDGDAELSRRVDERRAGPGHLRLHQELQERPAAGRKDPGDESDSGRCGEEVVRS